MLSIWLQYTMRLTTHHPSQVSQRACLDGCQGGMKPQDMALLNALSGCLTGFLLTSKMPRWQYRDLETSACILRCSLLRRVRVSSLYLIRTLLFMTKKGLTYLSFRPTRFKTGR